MGGLVKKLKGRNERDEKREEKRRVSVEKR